MNISNKLFHCRITDCWSDYTSAEASLQDTVIVMKIRYLIWDMRRVSGITCTRYSYSHRIWQQNSLKAF